MTEQAKGLEPGSQEEQFALALSAIAVAFAKTLRRLDPDEDALITLQRNLVGSVAELRRTPGSERAAMPIVRFVRDSLRNPDIIDQPED